MSATTKPNDPRGWLAQLPELEAFAGDPAIAPAMASGDGHRLHAALEARRRRPRTPAEVERLDRILSRRRSFLRPVDTAPGLFTLNGIGSRIYGRSDAAADGSFIGTYFFTFLYVPIWPSAQYLLLRDGRRYAFLGQVPLSRSMRRWRLALVPAAVALFLALVLLAWWSDRRAEVQLANGLDVPVVVTAGTERVELAPGARLSRTLWTGAVRFRAEAAGRVLEEVTGTFTSRDKLVAYNVAGAAPLLLEPVVYRTSDGAQSPAPPPEPVEFLGGRPFTAWETVDYVFAEPPKELRTGSRNGQTVRWRAFIPEGGWRATVGFLRHRGNDDLAAVVAARVAEAQPEDLDSFQQAVNLARLAKGPDAALDVARRGAEARPTALGAQKILSSAMLAAGRAAEARSSSASERRGSPVRPPPSTCRPG